MWNTLSNIGFYERLVNQSEKERVPLTENDVDFTNICRTCLREVQDSENLLKDFEIGGELVQMNGDGPLKMITMMNEATGLQATEQDNFPHQICNNCIQNISGSYFFRMQSRKAEKILLRLQESIAASLEQNNVDVLDVIAMSDSKSLFNEELDETTELEHLNESRFEVDPGIEDYSCLEVDFLDDNIEPENVFENILIDNCSIVSSESLALEELLVTDSKNIKNTFICKYCNINFSDKRSLQRHNREKHSEEKHFECEICGAKLTNAQTLKRHSKIHEEGQKNKQCPFCSKCFTRADDLKRHIRTHTGERPYKCSICPKRYKQSSELKEHFITHSTDRVYICSICGKCLLTRNGHYVHLKAHKGIKNHVCNHCGKKYVTSGELQSHKRHIHAKEKPFACTVENCEQAFRAKSSLLMHQRQHEEQSKCNLRNHPAKIGKTSCQICGKQCSSIHTLKKHVHQAKVDGEPNDVSRFLDAVLAAEQAQSVNNEEHNDGSSPL